MFFNELLLIGGRSSLINILTHILTLSKLIKCICILKCCLSKERSLDVVGCPTGYLPEDSIGRHGVILINGLAWLRFIITKDSEINVYTSL